MFDVAIEAGIIYGNPAAKLDRVNSARKTTHAPERRSRESRVVSPTMVPLARPLAVKQRLGRPLLPYFGFRS